MILIFCSSLCEDYATCDSGNQQSPIDLRFTQAKQRNFNLNFFYEEEEGLTFLNNGHTVEVEYSHALHDDHTTYQSDDYDHVQFHFHTPSENTLEGKHYDMEVHFVHSDELSNLLVVGVLIDAPNDNQPCDFLEQLLNNLPELEGEEHEVNILEYIELNGEDFFTFQGSLTTPPCTEGVTWMVRADPLRCASSQVDEFSSILGSSNRPVQPKNGRSIIKNFEDVNNTIDDDDNSSNDDDNDDDDSSAANYITISAVAILAAVLLL